MYAGSEKERFTPTREGGGRMTDYRELSMALFNKLRNTAEILTSA